MLLKGAQAQENMGELPTELLPPSAQQRHYMPCCWTCSSARLLNPASYRTWKKRAAMVTSFARSCGVRAASCPTAWYVKDRSPRPATSVVDSALPQSTAGHMFLQHAGSWHPGKEEELNLKLAAPTKVPPQPCQQPGTTWKLWRSRHRCCSDASSTSPRTLRDATEPI